MSTHETRPVVRHCDVLVVGGSAAGLAASLQLGRQRRSVIVVDAGAPRNAPAALMHGFLGRDGTPPSDLTGAGREEVRSYGGEVLDGRVVVVTPDGAGFRAGLSGGHVVAARQVLVATGLVDVLPGIEGVAEHWGRGVIHCPFCHGYEVRDRRMVQILTHPAGLHPTPLFGRLAGDLTVIVHEPTGIEPHQLDELASAGIAVERARARRVVTGPDGEVDGVELVSGTTLPADAVVVGPRFEVALEPFAALALGRSAHASGLGSVIDTDASGATSVPGVWAAGNATDPSHQVVQAAADGSRVGAMIAFALAGEDLAGEPGPTAAVLDWDRRYSTDKVWSGKPNGALVAEVEGATPGTVLDVGAGEGGDAVWLAEQGWTVTASDLSRAALERVRAEADRRQLRMVCLRADASALDAYGARRFDLVSAHYASIPRTGDDRAIRNLLGAVADGGTLLVVGHDPEPMRRSVDTDTASRAFDPDSYVRVEDVEAAVRADPSWVIETFERRPRPPGAASASHHVDDVVLRARRADGGD